MAKKKRKGYRRKSKKGRGASKGDRAMPLGAGAGAAVTIFKMIGERPDSGVYSVIEALTLKDVSLSARLDSVQKALTQNLADFDRYMPAVGGVALSAAPKVMGVRIVAKPMDKAIRRLSKGKVSL